MKRLLLAFVATLVAGSAMAISFFTIRLERKSDALQLYVNSDKQPRTEVGRLAAQVARVPGTPVRIQIDESTAAADVLDVLHLLATNGVQTVSIYWPRDRDGDHVCDFAENSEVMLTINKSMPNGCLEGEHWGYQTQKTEHQLPNQPSEGTR